MHVNNIGNVLDTYLELVSERQEQGGVEYLGIPTNFSQVDLHTGGLQRDNMWIIAAATASGKTAAALNIAMNAARYKPEETVLFYSLEMSAQSIVNRLLSSATELPSGKILRGKLTKAELKRVKDAADELHELDIQIVDSATTSDELTEHALGEAQRNPVSLVVVDYAGLLKDAVGSSETERVGYISRTIRGLARPDVLNTPVILLSQLNRTSQTAETRRPQLHHLKNSSNLEQDASVVLLLYRPAIEQQDKGAAPQKVEAAEIIIAKNREGMMGSTKAKFYPSQTRWEQK